MQCIKIRHVVAADTQTDAHDMLTAQNLRPSTCQLLACCAPIVQKEGSFAMSIVDWTIQCVSAGQAR